MSTKETRRTIRKSSRKLTPAEKEKYRKAVEEESREEVMQKNKKMVREQVVRDTLRDFWKQVKSAREEQGKSLRDLAKASGTTAPHLSDLESGKGGNPTVSTLYRIAGALNLTLTIRAETE